MKPVFAFLGAFFSALAANHPRPAPFEALSLTASEREHRLLRHACAWPWLTAQFVGPAIGITRRAALMRLSAFTAKLNGTRELYERQVPAPKGGGGGQVRLFNVAAIAGDFPHVISPADLERIKHQAGGAA